MDSNDTDTKEYLQKHELFLSKNRTINFFICPQNLQVNNAVESFLSKDNENLLLISGSIGIGKTHLVGSVLQKKGQRFLYVDVSDFVSTSYHYLKLKKPLQFFFNWLLSFEVLVFDDFQLIQGKDTILELMSSLINQLKEENKKGIFIYNTDKGTVELEKECLSWFDLQTRYPKPDRESLKIIAEKFLESYNNYIKLTKTALDYLIDATDENIQTVLDKLVKVLLNCGNVSFATYVGVEEIKKILNKIPKKAINSTYLSAQTYTEKLCKRLGFEFKDLLEESRKKELVYKRNLTIYLLKKKLNLSHTEIGQMFNKNHSTITHSIKQIEEKRKDKFFDEYLKTFL